MPSKKGRKPLSAGRNPPPQDTQSPVDFVLAGTVRDENTSEVAKDAMNEASASATMRNVHGRSIIANDQGATLIQSMEDRFQNLETQVAEVKGNNRNLEAQMAEVKGNNRNLEAQMAEVEAQMAEVEAQMADVKGNNRNLEAQMAEVKENNRKLSDLRNMYLNVRERAYLTFLRDHCAGYKETNRDKIKTLNQSVVHGGDALADASMFLERRLINAQQERRLFELIYGLDAGKIKELDCHGYRNIIQVLDAIGLAHLQGIMGLKDDQERVFKKIVELVQKGKTNEAEHAAGSFPFEPDYVPLDPFREVA